MGNNRHRWKIQLGATLASNPFLMNFLHGKIFRGGLKAACVPGLNCYSCPAAAASCPIGALQAVIGSSRFQAAYYVAGFLILAGVLLGRAVCGFLCPFGWFQELLHKLPTRKFSTRRLHILTWLKYGILALFVIVLPMTIVNEVGMGDPFFCKYLCPAGILEGGIPLAFADAPASGPAWADCSPGRAASCWGWSRWRFFATAPSASGSAPWGRSTACSTGSPSAVWRSTPANALPAGHAARRAKWMWRCSAPPTTASASGAGTVWQPAPMGPSPGHFP